MKPTVLISGVGQLGSRYLQGMAHMKQPIRIFAHDTSHVSLEQAEYRWKSEKTEGKQEDIAFLDSLKNVPEKVDCAIVATTADVRPDVVEQICSQTSVNGWLLEKVLAQSATGLDRLRRAIKDTPCWVNTPYFLFSLYRRLHRRVGAQPIRVEVSGKQGLACNAIHYIDLVSRWGGSFVTSVDVSGLNEQWYRYPKRPKFFDVAGILSFSFSDGSYLSISGSEDVSNSEPYQFKMFVGDNIITVHDEKGYAVLNKGARIYGAVDYQSTLTPRVVKSILNKRLPELPTLTESITQHRPLLESLTSHFNRSRGTSLRDLSIS